MERKKQQPLELIYCYAHKDRALRDELDIHLAGLRRSGLITSWYDGEILPGTPWDQEIKMRLEQAHIILLLVSPDFIHSDYCYSTEMMFALERHHKKEVIVIPILLRPSDWVDTPFSTLQILPSNTSPITRWPDRDEAFTDVVKGIRRRMLDLLSHTNISSVTATQKTAPQFPSNGQGVIENLAKDGKRRFPRVQDFVQAMGDNRRKAADTVPEINSPASQLHTPTKMPLAQDEASIAPLVIPQMSLNSSRMPMSLTEQEVVRPLPNIPAQTRKAGNKKGGWKFLFSTILIVVISLGAAVGVLHLQPNPTTSKTGTQSRHLQTLSPFSGLPAFSDPLTDNNKGNGWCEGWNPQKWTFRGGALHIMDIAGDRSGAGSVECAATSKSFTNVAYQVQMTIIKDSGSAYGGGIFFEPNTSAAVRCFFRVSSDGSYEIFFDSKVTTQPVQGRSLFIHTGFNQSNIIGAVIRANLVDLYINQHYIISTHYSSHSSGSIGMFLASKGDGSNPPDEVVFRNVEAWNV